METPRTAGGRESLGTLWGMWPSGLTAISVALLPVTLVADLLTPHSRVVLTVFYGLAPLMAAGVQGPIVIGLIGGAATLLAGVSASWTGTSPQYFLRLADVFAVSALSVVVAAMRTRRERALHGR